jgi:hypothetical protein
VLAALMRYWQPVSRALASASQRGAFFFSDAAGEFSSQMVKALLLALATHPEFGVHASSHAREWPSHDPSPHFAPPDVVNADRPAR